MKTYTTEEVNALLDEFIAKIKSSSIHDYFSGETVDQFKKDKGLLPTLEVEEWYKDDDNGRVAIIFVTHYENGRYYYYGKMNLYWQESASFLESSARKENLVLATEDEVREAFKSEIERRGYKEGVTVMFESGNMFTLDKGKRYIHFENNSVYFRGARIMTNGKWAKIVEDQLEPTLEVGKWYISEVEKSLFVWNNGNFTCGFFEGEFGEDWAFSDITNFREATEDEVLEALIAEANRRGLNKPCKLQKPYLSWHCIPTWAARLGFKFYPKQNSLEFNGTTVFINGDWAKPVEDQPEPTLEEKVKLLWDKHKEQNK